MSARRIASVAAALGRGYSTVYWWFTVSGLDDRPEGSGSGCPITVTDEALRHLVAFDALGCWDCGKAASAAIRLRAGSHLFVYHDLHHAHADESVESLVRWWVAARRPSGTFLDLDKLTARVDERVAA